MNSANIPDLAKLLLDVEEKLTTKETPKLKRTRDYEGQRLKKLINDYNDANPNRDPLLPGADLPFTPAQLTQIISHFDPNINFSFGQEVATTPDPPQEIRKRQKASRPRNKKSSYNRRPPRPTVNSRR